MAKRFLNDTEKKLIALLKTVMLHYKPRTGFFRALLNVLRTIGAGRPEETAHGLSVLVTQDLVVEIIGAYGTQAIAPSFLNVMALVDEEVDEHYDNPGRSPMFADMLRYAQEQIRRGNLLEHRWDVETFASFVDNYLRGGRERVSAEHLRQALEILYAPSSYRLLSTSWFLMRLLAAGYVRHTAEVIDSDEAGGPTSPLNSKERTAIKSLLRNYDERALSEMLDTEKGVMMSLYGTVLLSTYVNELREEVAREFAEQNRLLSRVLACCSALLAPLGTASVVAYCASMASSIIQQVTAPSERESFCALVNYSNAINSSGSSTFNETLVRLFGDNSCSVDNATLPEIFASREALAATNMSALPASIAVLTTMYLALPIIAFGGYAAQWVSRRMSSRGGGAFVSPARFSLLAGAVCAKLGLNTFLTLTAHVSHRAVSTALSWSVNRLYLPLSLIEQPKKLGLFINSAMSAAWSSRGLRFEPSSRACAIAAVLSVPFEYLGHIVANLHRLDSARFSADVVRQLLNFTVKHARVAAFFGTIMAARRHLRGMPYSRRLERIIWADAVKAVTAPPALLLLDLAAGKVFLTTVVLTLDSLVSLIPDMVCSANVDMLNNAGGRLAALEQWLVENLDEEALVKLATLTSLQRLPGSTVGQLEKILEDFYDKDKVEDFGMDLVQDNFGGISERRLLAEQSDGAFGRRSSRAVRRGDCGADASGEGMLIGATSSDYFDHPGGNRRVSLYEELVRDILERHGTRAEDALSSSEEFSSLRLELDDAAVSDEEQCDRGRSSRCGRFRFGGSDKEDFDVERQRRVESRRSRRSDTGRSSGGMEIGSCTVRSRSDKEVSPAASARRQPGEAVSQQQDGGGSGGPRSHPSGAIPKVKGSSAHTKGSSAHTKDVRKKRTRSSALARGDFGHNTSTQGARAARSHRDPGAPHDRVAFEAEGVAGGSDLEMSYVDLARFTTLHREVDGLNNTALPPRGGGRGAVAPGSSLTSLDSAALDILGALEERGLGKE